MKDGLLVDGQELDIAEHDQDSDFFGEKVSVRNWGDDNCKKQDGIDARHQKDACSPCHVCWHDRLQEV